MDRDEWADDPGDENAPDPMLPPDQRWWRHPSELGGAPSQPALTGPPTTSRAPLVLAGTIGVIGALLVVLLVRAATSEPSGTVAVDATSIAAPRTQPVRTSSVAVSTALVSGAPTAPDASTPAATPVLIGTAGTAPAAVVGESYVLASVDDLDGQTSVTLLLPSGEEHDARVVVTDEAAGVALLQVSVPLTTLAAGSATELAPGDGVYSADGKSGELVEVVARQQDGEDETRALLRVHMSDDVPTGTPLYDRAGRAIGFCLNGDDSGNVMVLPIEIARRLVDEAAGNDTRAVPWLGIKGRSEPDAEGARVVGVFDDGPAADAGVRADDVVVAMDGMAVRSMGSLVLLLERRAAGDTITLSVERTEGEGTSVVEVPVELATRPVATTTVAPPGTTAATTPSVPPTTPVTPPTTPSLSTSARP